MKLVLEIPAYFFCVGLGFLLVG